MYEPSSDDDDEKRERVLKAFGLTADDYKTTAATESAIEVYPENIHAVLLFNELSTQWRTGFSGATGLDYNVLFHKLDRLKLPDDEYQIYESDIRIMEFSALKEMRKSDKK